MRFTRKRHQHAGTPTQPTWASRKARKKAELAYATNMLTEAQQRAIEAQQQTATANAAAEKPAEDTSKKLPFTTRLLIAFTAFVVLGIALVIAVVVIGTQIGFYRNEMKVQLVDLSKLGIDTPLDLPTFTPIATEGVAWACTLMAVVLVMLNRPSGVWTKSMWFFSGINAAVNAWHALDTDNDLLGAVVKGGLSVAGPFIVHLFILWVRHVRTGKTLEEARHDLVIKWRAAGRFLLDVLGVVADHVTHPLIARRAFSLWRLYRGATYSTAWRAAVAEKLVRERRRAEQRSGRSPFARGRRSRDSESGEGEQSDADAGVNGGQVNTDGVNASESANGEHANVHEADGERVNGGQVNALGVNVFGEQDAFTVDAVTLKAFMMSDKDVNEAFAELTREMNTNDTGSLWGRSSVLTCDERVNDDDVVDVNSAVDGGVNVSGEHPGERVNETSEQPGVNAQAVNAGEVNTGEQDGVNAHRMVNTPDVNAVDSGEQAGVNTSEQAGVNTPVNGDGRGASGEQGGVNTSVSVNGERVSDEKVNARRVNGEQAGTNAGRVIAHYWKLVDGGVDVERVKKAAVAKELGIPAGTVRRVWGQCLKGEHPRP